MRDKKKLEELPQRAVILKRARRRRRSSRRAQLDALHAKADAQLSRIDDEDRSLSEKQRQVQSEIDAGARRLPRRGGAHEGANGFAKRRNTLEADLTVGDELA